MSYAIIPQQIPQDKRAEYNEKILFDIDTGKGVLPPETIYNCYTGIGGLHGLKQDDFENYNAYAQAKKEFEMGQFFTPHDICRQMVELVAPEPSEMVLDMGCGMGNFYNHLPNQFNAFGFDIDPKAVKVARYLYPDATIEHNDIRNYDPDSRFDILLGNPPYNLDFDRDSSQFYYCKKAYDVLNPAGIMALVVPFTFMQSEFWDKSEVRAINSRFSFIGQTRLYPNAFACVGVDNFETKIMVFARESSHIESKPYNAEEFITMEQLAGRVLALRELKQSLKLKLMRETNLLLNAEEDAFNYRLNKYLYELKAHPHLQEHYDKAVALVTKFRNQKPPENCTHAQYEEWDKKKLTYAQVLSIIYRYIRRQYEIPRKEVALVRTRYNYKLKAYAPHLLDDLKERAVPINELITLRSGLPEIPVKWETPKTRKQYKAANKSIKRKQREFLQQDKTFDEMVQNPELTRYIDSLSFMNRDIQRCEFTPLQKHDMNLLFQKRYSLLNWQQGSGKTAVAYHFGKYLRSLNRIRNIVVLAPAIAIELTWTNFLKCQKKKFIHVTRPHDLDNIRPGMVVIVSLTMLDILKREFKRFMKMHSHKICLIFDESDEITNDQTKRTRSSLNIFRRARYKMLATGTTTRNNIPEMYPQIEMLYNNSVNMLCYCDRIYHEERETYDIVDESNPYYGLPFPPRGGVQLFKACFNPGKATVFGIEKHNQDIFNKDQLFGLIGKTILTRKFKEFAGDKYEIINHNVTPGPGERQVYQKILKEFCEICYRYFNSTGDEKKEAALRLIRQIMLLIRACSVPHKIEGYCGEPFPRKVRFIADMVREMPGKVTIGCTTIEAMEMYTDYMGMAFPDRKLFVIHGEVTFKRRQKIIAQFEATENGILVCTQQSLKSSANIPSCDEVILESLQWNIPKMEQFYFRFIRLDSKGKTRVHFVTYDESIEQNLIALVLTKERLNEFIKCGEIKQQSEIFNEFDISPSLIENLLKRQRDKDGNFYISWGEQRVA